jgi:hypothetical protein
MINASAERAVRIWYDREGDFLEVTFGAGEGYSRETAHEHVMERVGADGHVIGFAIFGLSSLPKGPLDVVLGR